VRAAVAQIRARRMTAWRRRLFPAVFGAKGAWMMAIAIIIRVWLHKRADSGGSRVAYAMAKDGLFFRATGKLNKHGVPGVALVYQGIWIVVLDFAAHAKAGWNVRKSVQQYTGTNVVVPGAALLCVDDCGDYCAAVPPAGCGETYKGVWVSDGAGGCI